MIKTADLYDHFSEHLQIADPILTNFGGRRAFYGKITALKVFEDNSLVRESLQRPGDGDVLVVDGGGSLRCALLGDQLAELGRDNGWSGLIINGCIRDSEVLAALDIGVKALNTNPVKSVKRGEGQADIPVRFAGIWFHPGAYVYADADGIAVSARKLLNVESH